MGLITITSFLFILFLVTFIGCNHSTGVNGVTFRYSMESIGNFKVEFQLNPDSTYQIDRHNYFFDRFEGKTRSLTKGGSLTKEEFEKFRRLITGSKPGKLNDSYGFDGDAEADVAIVYVIELIQNEKSKFISVNAAAAKQLPDNFGRLIAFTAKFVSDQLATEE